MDIPVVWGGLSELDLNENEFSFVSDLEMIEVMIQCLSCLHRLNLGFNEFEKDHMMSILSDCARSTSLTDLNVTGMTVCTTSDIAEVDFGTKMDSTTINSFSKCCEETGFLLQHPNISAEERINFFDLGYMLIHVNHKEIKPQKISTKCSQLQTIMMNLMKTKQSDAQISSLIIIDQYIRQYLPSHRLTMYSAKTHKVDNSIVTH